MIENATRNYCPTPAEIQAACLEIQATWSEEVRADRIGKAATSAIRCDYSAVFGAARSAMVAKLALIREAA